jgi:hypothetical protein
VALRAGIPLHLLCEPKPIRLRPHGGDLSSDKILPRRY